ncbi:uncharacterized protein LOC134707810 [Mytilus trossulus]|uniref:uncharacterized protein LOC134707810 n=1 Tax=Mytilus trossulus TaxID=6551 RepID=UPI00300629EE
MTSTVSFKMAVTAYAKYALGLTESMEDDICVHKNCSGNGFCQDGQCICLIQFTGGSCQDANLGYFMAFGTIFVFLCLVAFVQLFLCISNEYQKQKTKSWKTVFKMTGPKLLYILTILATAIRGVYFFTKMHISDQASIHLWSAYYPILLSGSSLIVCFWAEAFHLEGIDCDKPRFLSKSIIGFVVINVVISGLLITQLVATDIEDPVISDKIYRICNGCVGLLLIIAVVFFLVYGVEVYFKVRGAFNKTQSNVDPWQLHMSRLGLIAQACLQLLTGLFLISDAFRDNWKKSLPVFDQNFYDIGFRIAEFGVVLWFPCVLWNCKSPESLWVLNPQKLFKTLKIDSCTQEENTEPTVHTNYGTISTDNGTKQDCWICYDPERIDAGDLIQPCQCKGDVASVHHECLRKWLMECSADEDGFRCKVCKNKYQLKETWTFVPRYIKTRHWLQTFLSLVIMVGSPFGAYTLIHSVTTATYIDVLTIGLCILVELGCLRFLATSLGVCYKRGRLSTIRIQGNKTPDIQTIFTPAHQSANQVSQNIVNSNVLTADQRGYSFSVEAVVETNNRYSRLE